MERGVLGHEVEAVAVREAHRAVDVARVVVQIVSGRLVDGERLSPELQLEVQHARAVARQRSQGGFDVQLGKLELFVLCPTRVLRHEGDCTRGWLNERIPNVQLPHGCVGDLTGRAGGASAHCRASGARFCTRVSLTFRCGTGINSPWEISTTGENVHRGSCGRTARSAASSTSSASASGVLLSFLSTKRAAVRFSSVVRASGLRAVNAWATSYSPGPSLASSTAYLTVRFTARPSAFSKATRPISARGPMNSSAVSR